MTAEPLRVLVLGGTTEARELATALAARDDVAVVSSLAGRVAAPALPPGEVRIGGFGGVDGLRAYLDARRVDAIVDATHPAAAAISRNAAAAALARDIPILALRRPAWTPERGDRWHVVPDADAAARLVPALGARVFLTTGRLTLAPFAALAAPWFLIRAIEPPAPPLPPRHELLLARGPFTLDDERALLARQRIDVLVTKNSGGAATAPKLAAARERGIPVVVVDRPAPSAAPGVADVGAALRWIEARVRAREGAR